VPAAPSTLPSSSPTPDGKGQGGNGGSPNLCGTAGATGDLLFPMTLPDGRISSSSSSSLDALASGSAPSLFSERIRQLQENNAMRLMEIYNPSGGGVGSNNGNGSSSSSSRPGQHLFRFSLRRDSLSGGTMGGMGPSLGGAAFVGGDGDAMSGNQMEQHLAMMSFRFPLRRDSLSHLGSSQHR
jgi:hypothetical protein